MSLQNYQLIKICYPVVLTPINPFILDVMFNNCDCPRDNIAIYLLQDRKGLDKTRFFFNYSQAIKEYKNKLKDEKKEDINDESDLLAFQFDIDRSFNYSINIIDNISLFKVDIITPLSYEDLE